MVKSKKRYLLLIISGAMCAIFALGAFADPLSLQSVETYQLYSLAGGLYQRLSNQTNITYTAQSAPLNIYVQDRILLNGEPYPFKPLYTYSGRFSFTISSNGYVNDLTDVINSWDDQFVLCNDFHPEDQDYHEVFVSDVIVTSMYPIQHTTSAGQNVDIYTCDFWFRIGDSLPYDDLTNIALNLSLRARAFTEVPAVFGFYSFAMYDFEEDLDGSVFMDKTLEGIQDLENSIDAFAEQNHVDLVQLDRNLNQLGFMLTTGMTDLSDFLEWQNGEFEIFISQELQDQLDRELSSAQSAGNASGSLNSANSTFSAQGDFSDGFQSLFNAINYTGTDFNFTFPSSGNVPYLGQLWSSKEIPIKYWIDQLPSGILYSVRFVFWIGVLYTTWYHFKKLVDMIGGK